MKKKLSALKAWWRIKTAGEKVLSVLCFLAVVCLVYVGVSFGSTYYADKQRRAALSATDTEGRPLNSRVHNGKVYVPNPDVTTYLIMGIDKKDDADISELKAYEFGQADSIMLAVLDSKAKTAKLVNIPRDTMVDIKTYAPDGSVDTVDWEQICLQYAYGKSPSHCAELMEKAITEQVFPGITIDHYAALHFFVLPVIVDDIGGLDITMSGDYDIMVYTMEGNVEPRHYDAGKTYHLYNYDAVGIAHYRDIDIYGSAMDRIERQKDFLRAFYHDAKEAVKNDPSLIPKIYSDIKKGLNTDLSLADIVSLASVAMDADFSVENSVVTLPGEVGEEIDFWDKMLHNTYEMDKDGAKQIMMDTWYLPWDGK